MDAAFKDIAEKLKNELLSSKSKLSIAIAWFTNESIFDILIAKLAEGTLIELILMNDHINNRPNGLDFNKFLNSGGKLYFSNTRNLMHNKFVIVDGTHIITGSYNWTYNAEFRNEENIVIISDTTVVKKFENEFLSLRDNSKEQKDRVTTAPESHREINYTEYLKNDFVSKSKCAAQKGDIEKSIVAVKQALEIDQSDIDLRRMLSELKMELSPEYHYHVEDGQFSFDFKNKKLLGKEGEIIKVSEPFDDDHESKIYILYIDDHYVECVGEIDRKFPKNTDEHEELKETMRELYNRFE